MQYYVDVIDNCQLLMTYYQILLNRFHKIKHTSVIHIHKQLKQLNIVEIHTCKTNYLHAFKKWFITTSDKYKPTPKGLNYTQC